MYTMKIIKTDNSAFGKSILFFKNGTLHREDGPAIDRISKSDSTYWIDGKQISQYDLLKLREY